MASSYEKIHKSNPEYFDFFEKIDGSGVVLFAIKGEITAYGNNSIAHTFTKYSDVRFDKNTFLTNVIVTSRMGHHFDVNKKGIFYFSNVTLAGEDACILVAFDDGEDLYIMPGAVEMLAGSSIDRYRRAAIPLSGLLVLSVLGIALIPIVWIWVLFLKPARLKKLYKKAMETVQQRPIPVDLTT